MIGERTAREKRGVGRASPSKKETNINLFIFPLYFYIKKAHFASKFQ